MIAVGLYVHHSFSVLMACRPSGSQACQALNRSFNTTDWTIANTLLILMTFAPVLIGAFTGATVVARELETGTFRYAWTQGIGRVRWTIAKLVLLGAVITVLTWALSQAFSWFYAPILQQQDSLTLLSATVFVTHGIAFAAWCLMAFTLGAFLGMLLRRVVGAMAATLGVYLGLGVVTWVYLRPHYPVALVTSNPSLFHDPGVPGLATRSWRHAYQHAVGAEHLERGPRAVVAVHPGEPVLADAVDRGRLAPCPLHHLDRRDGLARPPPGRLRPMTACPGRRAASNDRTQAAPPLSLPPSPHAGITWGRPPRWPRSRRRRGRRAAGSWPEVEDGRGRNGAEDGRAAAEAVKRVGGEHDGGGGPA